MWCFCVVFSFFIYFSGFSLLFFFLFFFGVFGLFGFMGFEGVAFGEMCAAACVCVYEEETFDVNVSVGPRFLGFLLKGSIFPFV